MIPMIGFREVFNVAEVAKMLGFTVRQVQHLSETGRLKKFGSGLYPYHQKDINEFLTRLNAGKVQFGVRRKKTLVAQ